MGNVCLQSYTFGLLIYPILPVWNRGSGSVFRIQSCSIRFGFNLDPDPYSEYKVAVYGSDLIWIRIRIPNSGEYKVAVYGSDSTWIRIWIHNTYRIHPLAYIWLIFYLDV